MPAFEVEKGGWGEECRQKPPSVLWFGGPCSSSSRYSSFDLFPNSFAIFIGTLTKSETRTKRPVQKLFIHRQTFAKHLYYPWPNAMYIGYRPTLL